MCPYCPASRTCVVKKGVFRRLEGGKQRRIQRYLCRGCQRTFSSQTRSLSFAQRKSEYDEALFRLLTAGVSQRKCAEIFHLHRTTVARKLVRFGAFSRKHNALDRLTKRPVATVVFDEMETFEHSKCKPLSMALAVEEGSRRLLSVHVAQMPAKGLLAAISRRRYGPRSDHRPAALARMMRELQLAAPDLRVVKSDESPRYPGVVRRFFPQSEHARFKGRRGCVVGQGELKAGGFDPLFSLNHTCAMYRDNLKRLSRRTWCTTKRPDRLQDLMDMYVVYHNARVKAGKRRPVIPDRW